MAEITVFPSQQSVTPCMPRHDSKRGVVLEGPGRIDRIDLIERAQASALEAIACDFGGASRIGILLQAKEGSSAAVYGQSILMRWSASRRCGRVRGAARFVQHDYRNSPATVDFLRKAARACDQIEAHTFNMLVLLVLSARMSKCGALMPHFDIISATSEVRWDDEDAVVGLAPIPQQQTFKTIREGLLATQGLIESGSGCDQLSFQVPDSDWRRSTHDELVRWIWEHSTRASGGYRSAITAGLLDHQYQEDVG